MTAPVHSVGEGATYARMTVSLNGWGVEMVGGTLYLECGLLFEGEEGSVDTARHAHSLLCYFADEFDCPRRVSVASSGPLPVLATSNLSKLQV